MADIRTGRSVTVSAITRAMIIVAMVVLGLYAAALVLLMLIELALSFGHDGALASDAPDSSRALIDYLQVIGALAPSFFAAVMCSVCLVLLKNAFTDELSDELLSSPKNRWRVAFLIVTVIVACAVPLIALFGSFFNPINSESIGSLLLYVAATCVPLVLFAFQVDDLDRQRIRGARANTSSP